MNNYGGVHIRRVGDQPTCVMLLDKITVYSIKSGIHRFSRLIFPSIIRSSNMNARAIAVRTLSEAKARLHAVFFRNALIHHNVCQSHMLVVREGAAGRLNPLARV